jgi:hypothetical protein
MKKLVILFAFFLPVLLHAQSVAINNDGSLPDNTALLDLKSSTKGVLIPRMTTAERNAISSPVVGLTVFDISTYSFWVFRGDLNGGWSELQHTYNNYWTSDGLHMHSKNTGNVGIGTNTPASKLTINDINPVFAIMNNGLANSFIQGDGANMKIGTSPDNPTGKLALGTKGNDYMFIDPFGRVSIGTSSNFDAEFKLNGVSPRFAFLHNDVQKGFIRLTGDDFKIGTYPGNSGRIILSPKNVDKVWIDETGQVGIGTSSPGSVLTVNGTNPIIQLRNGDDDKGFIQLVNDDMRVGLNVANANGRFIVRTDATDRVWVHNNGKVSMGTVSTFGSQLSIGNDFTTAGINFFNGNENTFNISSSAGNAWIETFTDQLILRSGLGASLYLKNSGQATIGFVTPANGYRLTVLGSIKCAEVSTSPIYNWPDYVFGEGYKLKPLAELKKFVDENKHLPNIPSATEVAANGIQLGDMSKRLIEKVEELTLYIFQLKEQIDSLKKQM